MELRKADHSRVPPIVTEKSHTLILGSMLSPKSAQAEFYYAHPQNRFWRVIAELFGNGTLPETVEAKTELVTDNGLALWDVISSCDILGASDSTIKNVKYNDIAGLLAKYPNINRVFTTGKKAYELLLEYNKTAQNDVIARTVCLPSTSPQNCRVSLDELVAAYSVIKA